MVIGVILTMKKIKLLVCSDDYDTDLLMEDYVNMLNHNDDLKIDLTIVEKIDFTIMYLYDIVVVDYGLFGRLTPHQIRLLEKRKNTFVTSALSPRIISDAGCKMNYVNFQFGSMATDLWWYMRSLCPRCNEPSEFVERTKERPRQDVYKCKNKNCSIYDMKYFLNFDNRC